MPPQKKKARTSKDADELKVLVKWLSREQLQDFVTRAVERGGLPISELWSAIPEQAAIAIRNQNSTTTVSSGVQRVGTGYFDDLDDNVMSSIFSYCPLLSRIQCVTTVCKSWRNYKTSLPGLFSDVSEQVAETDKATTLNRAQFALALLRWIPTSSSIPEGFRLSTSKVCNPRICKAVLTQLSSFHFKKLVLQGCKISPDALKKISFGRSIECLVFEDVEGSNTGSNKLGSHDAIPNLLKTCPNLEELTVPQYLMFERSLRFHLAALSEARAGAPLLLTKLNIAHWRSWGCDDALDWCFLSKLGDILPNIQELKLTAIETPVQADPSTPPFTPAVPSVDQFLQQPFAPMPHLKVFLLSKISPIFEHESRFALYPRMVATPYLTKIISRLLEAMPNVKDFSVGHGERPYLNRKEMKQAVFPPFPKCELADLTLPASLQKLTLAYMLVEPDEFEGLKFSNMEWIRFVECGPGMKPTMEMLHSHFPHLSLSQTDEYYSRQMCLSRFCPAGVLSQRSTKWFMPPQMDMRRTSP